MYNSNFFSKGKLYPGAASLGTVLFKSCGSLFTVSEPALEVPEPAVNKQDQAG